MKYFVTGASGFVGRHICKTLIRNGQEVKALVRNDDTELKNQGVKIEIGDLWDSELLQNAISKSDIIIHCAGNPHFGNGDNYYKDNVELTKHLIDIVSSCAKSSRFIYISTIGAVDRDKYDKCLAPLSEAYIACPTSDYGKSKLQAEQIVAQSGLQYSIIRPSMVVGKDMRTDSHFSVFAQKSLQKSLFARIAWPGKFSVVHVDDLAHGIFVVSNKREAAGQIFFCAGEEISLADFFRQCSPGTPLISISLITTLTRRLSKWIPFSLKALTLSALTASDEKLRDLGWSPKFNATSAISEVIHRERSRIDPDISPDGQTVITGAASGLGRALAEHLSSRRKNILLIDKDHASLDLLAQKIPNCTYKVVDLADYEQIEALLNSPKWVNTEITEIYACAGIGLRGRMQDISVENHIKMFAVNVLARISIVKNAVDKMKRRHFGRIVLISSSSAFQPLPNMATYAATNSALLSLGESWREEMRDDNIHIMTVCPGGMKTSFQKNAGVKENSKERLMTPEAVVENIMEGLRTQKGTLIISFRSLAMSLLARFLPRIVSVKLWFHLMEKMR